MNKCYLIIVSRNKWLDYGLVTDFPASLGSHETGLKKRIKGFFPLDHADREIKISDKLIESNVHLQSWCGRIESFGIDGLPYVEQIGRPIKLAVGILQELSIGREFVRYKFDDFESLLPPLLQDYQLEKGYKPKLIELQDIGIKGDLTLWKDFDQLSDDLTRSTSNPVVSISQDPIPACISLVNKANLSRPLVATMWLDDLISLCKLSLKVLDLLGRQSRCHTSKIIHQFLSSASKRAGSFSTSNVEDDWRMVFKSLVDAWNLPLDKKFFYVTPKLDNPFWHHPSQGIRDATKLDILNQQLSILKETLEEDYSLESIDFRFGQISADFHAVLLDMLD
jgi:hypothetical protein